MIACLIPAVVTAIACGGGCLMAGWGWVVALLAYSFGGALALLAFAALALLFEGRSDAPHAQAHLSGKARSVAAEHHHSAA